MRKRPRQARSRQMVDALLQAAAEVIAEQGLAHTTTNHVAERAGVSIGSLYQYFESKDALIEALMAQQESELVAAVQVPFASLLDADLRTFTRAALEAVFELFERKRGLYLELARGWYHARTMRTVRTLESLTTEALRLYLIRHHRELRHDNLPAALYVAFSSAVFTGIRYLSDPPPHLRRQDVLEQLTDLVVGHLLRTGQGARPPSRRRRLSA